MKQGGHHAATPPFITVLVVETTDLIFAVDSNPAILAITSDPFIVCTSNVFAILGLRALYFTIAGMIQRFQYLHYGLSAILVFVGMKVLLSGLYKIPVGAALGAVAMILLVSVVTSIAQSRKNASAPASTDRPGEDISPPASSGRKGQP